MVQILRLGLCFDEAQAEQQKIAKYFPSIIQETEQCVRSLTGDKERWLSPESAEYQGDTEKGDYEQGEDDKAMDIHT